MLMVMVMILIFDDGVEMVMMLIFDDDGDVDGDDIDFL